MNNEHEGHGGSYIVDPKTGERVLVERTAEAPAEQDIAPAQPVETE